VSGAGADVMGPFLSGVGALHIVGGWPRQKL
jgi:hypothetical protein